MTFAQIVGLKCRHKNLSMAICHRQSCTDCGESWDYTALDVTVADREQAARVSHYVVKEAIKIVSDRRLLQWKRK